MNMSALSYPRRCLSHVGYITSNEFLLHIAMVNAAYSDAHYKLHICQKDLRLAVNMSDSVDQPLHVSAAVNEVTMVT